MPDAVLIIVCKDRAIGAMPRKALLLNDLRQTWRRRTCKYVSVTHAPRGTAVSLCYAATPLVAINSLVAPRDSSATDQPA
jgi:hypothetical protein